MCEGFVDVHPLVLVARHHGIVGPVQEVRQLLQWVNEQTKGQSLEQAPSLAIGF